MYFNKFNSSIVDWRNIKNFSKSLTTVSNMFEGENFCFNHIDIGFRNYSRLFSKVPMKDWEKLYNLIMIIWDKFETDYFGISYRETDAEQNRINNIYNIKFPGYLEDGELYNRYAQCDVTGEPHEKLFYEFQLNQNFTKRAGDKILQNFFNNHCKEEI